MGTMTELIVPRGDTFPRTYLNTYRACKNEDIYNDLTSSKSDELVLQNTPDIPVPNEIHHGHSENILDSACRSPTRHDFLDKSDIVVSKTLRSKKNSIYDRINPEDSIRDIVSENDFYRFVLFKKHYDKYLHLSQKYEEARNIVYYLEEKYHEVKTEKDDLLQQREELIKRLELNESLLREKEDEVFLSLERVIYLEEQCDKLKAEKEKLLEQQDLIKRERQQTLRLLQEQARESEHTKRKMESARQEVVHHLTIVKDEQELLKQENDRLKEELEAEQNGMSRYLSQVQRRMRYAPDCAERKIAGVEPEKYHSTTLASQFQKAVEHLANCKQKKCSVCAYAKASYKRIPPSHHKYDRKLFGCLQTPFLEMRNMIRPPKSPLHAGEGESLSEWFCPVKDSPSGSGYVNSDCSSFSIPFADSISFMDDVSQGSFDQLDEFTQETRQSLKGCGSDSGFSSNNYTDFKSDSTTPREKFSPNSTLDECDRAKLTRTKWTASFRKIIRKIRK